MLFILKDASRPQERERERERERAQLAGEIEKSKRYRTGKGRERGTEAVFNGTRVPLAFITVPQPRLDRTPARRAGTTAASERGGGSFAFGKNASFECLFPVGLEEQG